MNKIYRASEMHSGSLQATKLTNGCSNNKSYQRAQTMPRSKSDPGFIWCS